MPASKMLIERLEWQLGNRAILTVSQMREILFGYAERDRDFKEFLLSRRAPNEVECLQWLVAKLETRTLSSPV